MSVVLGPAAILSGNYGSTPSANTPGIMRKLLDDHGSYGWVAGHLLNDNLGGPGIAENLTPLTTAGNKNHLNTCEAKIKDYLTAAFRRTEYHKGDAMFYGVAYEVQVSDEKWGTDAPWCDVACDLKVSVKAVAKDKASGIVSDLDSSNDPAGLFFAPMNDVVVDNTGWENIDS